jgi:hypothetical protein
MRLRAGEVVLSKPEIAYGRRIACGLADDQRNFQPPALISPGVGPAKAMIPALRAVPSTPKNRLTNER